MMVRAFTLCVLAALSLAGLVAAQEPVDAITRRLEQEGFTVIDVERTLLGRVMIRAENARSTREIVVDRATGEILRDYTEEKGGGSGALEPEGEREGLAGLGGPGAAAWPPGAERELAFTHPAPPPRRF